MKRLAVFTSYLMFIVLVKSMTHPLVDVALSATATTGPKLIVLLFGSLTTLQLLELAGYYLPSLIGVLFFISFYSTAHDVSTLFLSIGLATNNLINSGLLRFLKSRRPEPFLDPGQPSRQMQTMFFFVTFYGVYAHFWSSGRRWTGPFTLIVTISWSLSVYIANDYYTWFQVLGGAFVGFAYGFAYANWVRLVIIPHASGYVTSWNGFMNRCWWTFGCLRLSHVYHWHPNQACDEKSCKGDRNYVIVPIVANTSTVDFGTELFLHTLEKILVYALIHFNT